MTNRGDNAGVLDRSGPVRPTLFISRCLGFERCRYNAVTIIDPVVELLKPFVDSVTECPEVAIGLGVPRPPIRIVETDERRVLYQPETKRDVTEEMTTFCSDFLSSIGEVDGFLLKYRSPSCGPSQVKIYNSFSPTAGHRKGAGMFAEAVIDRFPGAPVEDEGRLQNFSIRHHFLTRVFTQARLRAAAAEQSMHALVRFHATHKHLLLAYNETKMRSLGRLVANEAHHSLEDVLSEYSAGLSRALAEPARHNTAINVLEHALGYVSDSLTSQERAYFLDTVEQYRSEQVPLSVPSALLRSWALRFDVPYLLDQTFYEPYPATLVRVLDSGKGRPL